MSSSIHFGDHQQVDLEDWGVVAEPTKSGNTEGASGKNEGGLIIYLVKGAEKREVTRVAYERKNSTRPKVKFDKQLQVELEKAQHAADIVNELEQKRRDHYAELARIAAQQETELAKVQEEADGELH